MKRLYKICLLLIVIIMIASCSSSKSASGPKGRPVWMDNPAAAYPERNFLSARGAGDSREAAEIMHREILQKFLNRKFPLIKQHENGIRHLQK